MSETTMPECPACGNNENVWQSSVLNGYSHFCAPGHGWFTPQLGGSPAKTDEATELRLRIAELERSIRSHIEDKKVYVGFWKQEQCEHKRLGERVAELERQLAAAKEDAARLDWLEANPEANEPLIVYHPPSDLITWRINSDKSFEEYKTLREAIDAARKEAK